MSIRLTEGEESMHRHLGRLPVHIQVDEKRMSRLGKLCEQSWKTYYPNLVRQR